MIKLIKISDRLYFFIFLLILKKLRVLLSIGCIESLFIMEYLVKISDYKNKRFYYFFFSFIISLYLW